MASPKRSVAFSNVLYVTAAENDAWFPAAVADNNKDNTSTSTKGSGGSSDDVATAVLEANKIHLGLDKDNSDSQIGKAVKAETLADW